ncbi:MAG: DUF721 domain-containing protein [Lentisphaeria bacterium]|nr:DUF721 domain-containing protein [Lentisphaeria bacterium]
MESMLTSWLGEEEGRGEFLRFRPESKEMSSLLERAVSRCIKPWTMKVMKLQESWQEIAGPDIARKCTVVNVENSIVYIEVRHPAFLAVLNSPRMKKVMLEKIHTVLSREDASEIKFLAAGGRTMR